MAKYSDAAYSLARRVSASESDVLIAENSVKLDDVLLLFGGLASDARDNFDLVVDKEAGTLLSFIRDRFYGRGLPLARKWFWPRMAPMGCVLTHDIDWLEYSPFHKQVMRQSSNPIRLVRLCYGSLVRKKNYGWNIPEMVRLEQDHGFRSTFLFQTSYWSTELVEKSLELVKEASFELALHGAHSSHKDAGALKNELDSFRANTGEDALGLRYHILKFNPPKTWELEAAAGLVYDATFYYNEFFGFRGGTCFPYHPFSNGKRIPILELPTGYMDWTSLHKGLSGNRQEEMFELSRKTVEERHGLFVANFHNTYMNKETFPHLYRIFGSLLDAASKNRYWVGTALRVRALVEGPLRRSDQSEARVRRTARVLGLGGRRSGRKRRSGPGDLGLGISSRNQHDRCPLNEISGREVSSFPHLPFPAPRWEGYKLGLSKYIENLSARGIQVRVLLAGHKPRTSSAQFAVPVIVVPGGMKRLPKNALVAAAQVTRSRADVVHVFTGSSTLLGVYSLALAKLLGAKAVMSLFGREDFQFSATSPRLFLRLSTKLADSIDVNSDSTGSLLPRDVQSKIHVLMGAAEEPVGHPQKNLAEEPVLLFVGRLVQRKGVDDLLRAFAIIHPMFPSTRLCIVGDGPEMSDPGPTCGAVRCSPIR